MTPSAPRVGFDRYIQLDWVKAAVEIRLGLTEADVLTGLLAEAKLTAAAQKKVRTILNRLWIQPPPNLSSFADRGGEILASKPDLDVAVLAWGMAVASYPFFSKVAEVVGRLTALQGDCTSAEVHRRMSETYGEREGTYRMTNMVLQSQANWGAIVRDTTGKRLSRLPSKLVTDSAAVEWLVESAIRYYGHPMPVPSLSSTPVLYPFALEQPLGYLAANSGTLELRLEGASLQCVALRQAA